MKLQFGLSVFSVGKAALGLSVWIHWVHKHYYVHYHHQQNNKDVGNETLRNCDMLSFESTDNCNFVLKCNFALIKISSSTELIMSFHCKQDVHLHARFQRPQASGAAFSTIYDLKHLHPLAVERSFG